MLRLIDFINPPVLFEFKSNIPQFKKNLELFNYIINKL